MNNTPVKVIDGLGLVGSPDKWIDGSQGSSPEITVFRALLEGNQSLVTGVLPNRTRAKRAAIDLKSVFVIFDMAHFDFGRGCLNGLCGISNSRIPVFKSENRFGQQALTSPPTILLEPRREA